jgi:hypothetical protein
MDASRAALMVVGVNLVAVWAAAAAGGRAAATEPAAAAQTVEFEAVVEARASLVASTERLEAHARRDVAPAMVRDPRPPPLRDRGRAGPFQEAVTCWKAFCS